MYCSSFARLYNSPPYRFRFHFRHTYLRHIQTCQHQQWLSLNFPFPQVCDLSLPALRLRQATVIIYSHKTWFNVYDDMQQFLPDAAYVASWCLALPDTFFYEPSPVDAPNAASVQLHTLIIHRYSHHAVENDTLCAAGFHVMHRERGIATLNPSRSCYGLGWISEMGIVTSDGIVLNVFFSLTRRCHRFDGLQPVIRCNEKLNLYVNPDQRV